MDEGREKTLPVAVVFHVSAQVCGSLGEPASVSPSLCLPHLSVHLSLPPSLSAWVEQQWREKKNLWLPGNYGLSQNSGAVATSTSCCTLQLACISIAHRSVCRDDTCLSDLVKVNPFFAEHRKKRVGGVCLPLEATSAHLSV